MPLILLGLFNSSHESCAISKNWAPQIFPAIRYLPIALSSDRALANSIMTAVPELGSAAPNTQASRWLPRITNRSKLHKKVDTITYYTHTHCYTHTLTHKHTTPKIHVVVTWCTWDAYSWESCNWFLCPWPPIINMLSYYLILFQCTANIFPVNISCRAITNKYTLSQPHTLPVSTPP